MRIPTAFIRSCIFTGVLWLLCIHTLSAQKFRKDFSRRELSLSMTEIVSYLAHDSLQGRLSGSEQNKQLADYLAGYFRNAGLKPIFKRDGKQYFSFSDAEGKQVSACNVAWRCGNKKGPIILIGAHFDHIGLGGRLSRNPLKTEVHNGADDNASGIAALLTLSMIINKLHNHSYNYYFVAFDAHEPGLFGSTAFASVAGIDSANVLMMINLDMVGRMDSVTSSLFVAGDTALIHRLPQSLNLNVKETQEAQGDQSAFQNKGIPVMRFTTGMHDDYHKVTDDAERINYDGLSRVVRLLATYLMQYEMRRFQQE